MSCPLEAARAAGSGPDVQRRWTLRDEATPCAYAFCNGFIEDIHASGRITEAEMKKLMIEARPAWPAAGEEAEQPDG